MRLCPLLSRGASGSVVSALQKVSNNIELLRLTRALWTVTLGRRPEAAVKAYQQDRDVEVDGIVGDQTWWVLAGAAGLLLRRCLDSRRCDSSPGKGTWLHKIDSVQHFSREH